jgi:hypothetical protein
MWQLDYFVPKEIQHVSFEQSNAASPCERGSCVYPLYIKCTLNWNIHIFTG